MAIHGAIGTSYYEYYAKHLGDLECDTFISRLGVRYKTLQITADYKPVGEPPEIMDFDAATFSSASSSHPSAEIQKKSETQSFSSCYQRALYTHSNVRLHLNM